MNATNFNWARNLAYRSTNTQLPASVSEIQDIVAESSSLKALGTRHCFNQIADTDATHLSLAKLNRILKLDREKKTVTIEGGVRYGELGAYLNANGFALPNLASLPHISVIGAMATATHGSGVRNQSLASPARAAKFVVADGSVSEFSKRNDRELFSAIPVHLGALGILVELTLDIEPAFEVRQDLFENLPLKTAMDQFEPIASAAYSVSLFTDWQSKAFHQVWLKSRTDSVLGFDPSSDFFGASPATEKLHPLPGHDAHHCTEQMGMPGPWHERLPHFRLEFTPSSGEELQSEYFIPRKHAAAGLEALFELRSKIAPNVFVTEIRTIAAEELWLSPAYQRDCVAFHFTWRPQWKSVREILSLIESALAPFSPRPHWGKLFTTDHKTVLGSYPKATNFKELAAQLDPDRKFRNDYLNLLLGD